MRSNQLSYSPELLSGEKSLLALSFTLNRAHHNLFFQYRDPNAANEVGDQVEHCGAQDPNGGEQNDHKEAKKHGVEKQLNAVELERLPTKRLEKSFDVVDGARCRSNAP